ncbi:MAG: ABC transporter permease [Planctomycetes bacterium]|nr:ABC transporter permease [Planctomycetota bacterium]
MFLRVVAGSLRRRWRRKAAALLSIALGTGAATGLFAIFLGVGDAVRAEFHSNRHNILVEPAVDGGYLRETDLEKIRDLKWRNQIVSWAPLLPVEVTVEGHGTATLVGTWWKNGLAATASAWEIDGAWSDGGVLVGGDLARAWGVRPGDVLRIGARSLPVAGIVRTGEEWDRQILADLAVAQEIGGLGGKVKSVLVNAVTTPDSEIVRKFERDPKSLAPQDFERFNCTPFAATIAMELRETIPNADARPIRRATDSESKLLRRVDAVLLLLAIAALVAGALGVMSAMTATVVERRPEIGLLKALGATDAGVASVFLAEAGVLAVAGGAIGCGIAWAAAGTLGGALLGRTMAVPSALILLAFGAALVVAVGGMVPPLRSALKVDPTRVLHEA